MATGQRTTGLTYQDLDSLFPDEDLVHRELIDGELFVTPSPTTRHQQVVAELVWRLVGYAKEHSGQVLPAPYDVHISDRNVLQPDVLFVAASDVGELEERRLRSAPALVVEVSSPSTRRRDLCRSAGSMNSSGSSSTGSSISTP